jgi:hypothetical protein
MSANEQSPISGSTTLTRTDNLIALRYQLGRPVAIIGSFLFVALMTIGLFDAPSGQDPINAMASVFSMMWPFMAGGLAGFVALLTLACVVKWLRFPKENKSVTYIADDNGITTRDSVGASIHMPWSMIKYSWKTRGYLVTRTKAGGLRIAPFRAFTPVDAERLWQLAGSKTPTR